MIFLGIMLGIIILMVSVFCVWQFAPDLAARATGYLAMRGWGDERAGDSPAALDQFLLKGMVQDILASDQAKAIMSDLLDARTRETFETFLIEAMKSTEFRKALADALETFLKSPEGRTLVRKIAEEMLTP